MEVGLLLLVGFGALVVPRGSGGVKMPGGPVVPRDMLGAPCDGRAGSGDGCRHPGHVYGAWTGSLVLQPFPEQRNIHGGCAQP